MKQFCIIIPVYKPELDCVEEISLKRLYTVIGKKNYDVILVIPELMDISNYEKLYPGIQYVEFSPEYFKSTATYSQLCISYDFYKSFDNYEYMYIYQLDCYLFRDELSDWCNKGYDYIGGPIISTDCGWTTVQKHQDKTKWHPYIGNGGFSLRKIETFMDICNPNGELHKMHPELNNEEFIKSVRFEDKYFCNDLYDYYQLDIPGWIETFNFALDMSVDVIYNFFKWKGLPMAIHSWDKNIRWWKKHDIPELVNNQKVIDYCEKKHEAFFKLYYDENDSTMR